MPGLPLKNPWTRPIPNPSQDLPNLFACVSALKETVESLIGQRGRSPNRAVTFNDLTAMGILTDAAISSPDGSFAPPQGPPGPQGPTGPTGPTGATGPAGSYQAGSGIAINTGTAPPTISTAVPYLPLTGGSVSGTIFNTASNAAAGAFHMAPNAAGTTYGSFWYNDGTATYLLLTNNNDALGTYNGLRPFQVNDATGAVAMGHGLNLSAGALQLAFVDFATQDAIFHHLRDKSGRAAILLGGIADSENYYDNTTHRFRGVNGATYDYYIDSGGITIQNSVAFRGRKTDNTLINLAYIDSSNNVIIGGYGSGLNCFVGSGGSYFGSDGNFYAGVHIILKNGLSLYATNAAGTNNYPLIGVASDNRIKINSSAYYGGVDAYGAWTFANSISAPDVTALGAGAIFVFADRAAAASGAWGWYANAGIARLWNAGSGDRVTVDTAGNMTFAGNYYYFAGGTGAVSAAGGPFIYFDNFYIIAHCGSGNGGFRVQNKDGTYVGGFDGAGWVLGINDNKIALRDANYTQFQDAAGNTALFLGGTADPSNYYRNTSHRFQTIGGAGDLWLFQNPASYCNTHIFCSQNNIHSCGNGGNAWFNVVSYNFTNASDERDKADIRELPDCLDLVRKIQPKRYKFNNAPEHDRDRVHWGFVAQEVGKAMQDAGHDFGGHYIGDDEAQSQGLSTNDLVAVLWKACQELTARVQSLEGERV